MGSFDFDWQCRTQMNSLIPTNKMQASGLAGASSILVMWILGMFNVQVPAEAASAITVLFSFIAGYFAPKSTQP